MKRTVCLASLVLLSLGIRAVAESPPVRPLPPVQADPTPAQRLQQAKARYEAALKEAGRKYAATLRALLAEGKLTQADRKDVQNELARLGAQAKPEAGDGKTRTVRLKNAVGQDGLKRLNKYTHIYSFSNDQAWVQFSFGKRPFNAANPMAAIVREFKYANIEVRFPEKSTPKSRVYAQLMGPIRKLGQPQNSYNMKSVKLTITSFKSNRLQGRFEGTITKLTTRTMGPGLRTGDIAGMGHTSKDAKIPFVVEFDLSVDSPD